MSAGSDIQLERLGSVGVVHLARRPVNAINPDFVSALDSVVDRVESDESVRSVLVVSDLDVFAAGADLKMLEASGGKLDERFASEIQRVFNRLEALSVPVVAALNGHALGGGLELALACDFRVVADVASIQLGLPEVRVGLLPAAGGTQRLARLLGKTRALDLLLTGRALTPTQAHEWGVVNTVVPAEQLYERALGLAEDFGNGPTKAYSAIKACVLEALHSSIENGLAVEREQAERLFATVDTQEGLKAFVEGRQPDFVGH